MKKTTLFITLSAFAFSAFGQRGHNLGQSVAPVAVDKFSPAQPMAADDTLWGNFPLGSNTGGTATPSFFGSSGGGWIGGHNGYADKAKAQSFTVTTPYNINGCVFWFGAKVYTSANPQSKVVASLYNMDGSGTLSTGPGITPGTPITSTNTDILIASIDTSLAGNAGFVFVSFATPYYTTVDYGAGIDLTPTIAGDSVGLVHTDTGKSVLIDQSFDKWSDDSWHSFAQASNWGMDVDLAIFPIVNQSSGVSELFFINGIKLYQNYPNPLKENTTINFELEKEAKHVQFFVHDVSGKQVKKIDFGNLSSGKHTVSFDANELAQGTYYFMLQADHNRIAKQMSIVE